MRRFPLPSILTRKQAAELIGQAEDTLRHWASSA